MTLEKAKKIIKSECYIADLLNLDRTRMVNTALDTVIEAAERTRWIPVSERLPEENGSYLVTVKRGYIVLGLWVGITENWKNVVAYMPLPQPYKAEGSDEECNSVVAKSEE